MATKLDAFPERSAGRPSSEDWDKWLDGGVWRLVRGEDFHKPKCESMRSVSCMKARERGLKVRTRVDGDSIVIQAYVPNGSA